MPLGSGLDTTFGIKAESVFGTPVTVDSFTDIESESIKAETMKIESPALNTLIMRTRHVKTVTTGASGDITFPFYNKGMSVLLKQCYGSQVDAQVGATAEYTHTFIPDLTNGKRGVSATVQLGRASVDGTLRPFTYEGGKVVAFTIQLEASGLLKLITTWAFEDESTATGAAAVSYLTNLKMFDWSEASVSLDGTDVFVRSFAITHAWSFDLERRGLSQVKRKEPIANGQLAITGEMEGEFENLDHYQSFIAGTQQPLVFTVLGSTIPTAVTPYKVVITCPAVELTGDTPNVGGPEILTQPMPFRALYNGTTAAVSTVVHNDSAT